MTGNKMVLALLMLAALVSFVDSYGPCKSNGKYGPHFQECKDCTKGNYYWYYFSEACCPKTGYCNIFCYNCDSPCRESQGPQHKTCDYKKRRSISDDSYDVEPEGEKTVKYIMRMADTDRDGKLSYREANLYLSNGTHETVEGDGHLIEMDFNMDGFLTPQEINPDHD